MSPETRYARAGELSIAYQVVGEGELDLVLNFPFVSHLDLVWESQPAARFIRRLASFARVLLFDKRGIGLSDPVDGTPTLEERMDDMRAVMDAVGSERAALLGMSEGAPMAVLFAATYPERTSALVLWGAMARSVADDDYPWAPPKEALMEAQEELIGPLWGQGATIDIFAPSVAADPRAREQWARLERQSASPRRIFQLARMFLDIDVRQVLPLVQAPTLAIHRRGDRAVNVRAGRWLAEQIGGARYVELPGDDHQPWIGDPEPVLAEIEEFLTGARHVPEPDRQLATVLFTDIVASTARAAELGDRRWRELLQEHDALVRAELDRFRGREVKSTGDGFLATFDGPARGIRCACAIRDAVRSLGVEVRAGLHTGECEVLGADVGGIAIHIGARVAAQAAAGEVLVSGTVRDLVAGSGIEFADRGVHELRGVPGEWRLLAVTGG